MHQTLFPQIDEFWIFRVNFLFQEISLVSKERLFNHFFRYQIDKQLLQKSCLANFRFGGTLFSKIIPNFCRPHAMSIHEIQQILWSKSILLYPRVRSSTTLLTLSRTNYSSASAKEVLFCWIFLPVQAKFLYVTRLLNLSVVTNRLLHLTTIIADCAVWTSTIKSFSIQIIQVRSIFLRFSETDI